MSTTVGPQLRCECDAAFVCWACLRELERLGMEKNLTNSAALVQQANQEFECVRDFGKNRSRSQAWLPVS
jgi:hypothetical protein